MSTLLTKMPTRSIEVSLPVNKATTSTSFMTRLTFPNGFSREKNSKDLTVETRCPILLHLNNKLIPIDRSSRSNSLKSKKLPRLSRIVPLKPITLILKMKDLQAKNTNIVNMLTECFSLKLTPNPC